MNDVWDKVFNYSYLSLSLSLYLRVIRERLETVSRTIFCGNNNVEIEINIM